MLSLDVVYNLNQKLLVTCNWPSIFQTFFLELSSLIVIMSEVNEPFDLLHCFIITIIVVGDDFLKVLNVLIEIIKNYTLYYSY